MSKPINDSLQKLRDSLEHTQGVDAETLALAQNLEADIQRLLDSQEINPDSSVDLALALESKFESEHPMAAGVVREIINALHKMGI